MVEERTRRVEYLGFIALILGFAVIHWLKPVLFPLVVALFMIAVAWPITRWLDGLFPKRVSYILSYAALVGILCVFGLVAYLAIAELTGEFPKYEDQFITLLNELRIYFRGYGLPTPQELQTERLKDIYPSLIEAFYATFGHVLLVVALVILGLPELVFWKGKLRRCLGEKGQTWRNAGAQAATSFQRYLSVMTAIGLIDAVLTAGFCWLMDLDFSLSWGVLAFVMNFIPVVGAVMTVLPPVLVAMMQFSDPIMVWGVLIGLGLIQFFIGNIIGPKLQSRFFSMSPVVLLVSLAFWTFLWGPAGAFLAVPLTHIFIIICFQFPNTQHIACLLSEGRGTCQIPNNADGSS